MMINHLMYVPSGLPVARLLTCNNVTAAHQLRKMPEQVERAAAVVFQRWVVALEAIVLLQYLLSVCARDAA